MTTGSAPPLLCPFSISERVLVLPPCGSPEGLPASGVTSLSTGPCVASSPVPSPPLSPAPTALTCPPVGVPFCVLASLAEASPKSWLNSLNWDLIVDLRVALSLQGGVYFPTRQPLVLTLCALGLELELAGVGKWPREGKVDSQLSSAGVWGGSRGPSVPWGQCLPTGPGSAGAHYRTGCRWLAAEASGSRARSSWLQPSRRACLWSCRRWQDPVPSPGTSY